MIFLFSRMSSWFPAKRDGRFCRRWYHWKAHPWKHIGRHQNYVPILSDSWDTGDPSFIILQRVKCGNFRTPISALYPLWTSALPHSALPQFTHTPGGGFWFRARLVLVRVLVSCTNLTPLFCRRKEPLISSWCHAAWSRLWAILMAVRAP